MKVTRKQCNAKDCIVCGIDNPYGIKASFYEMEDDSVCALFQYQFHHQSYPERVHGGMICAIIDETIGRAIWCSEPETYGCTLKINIEYHKGVPYNTPLRCIGRIDKKNQITFHGTAEIRTEDGVMLAKGDALYMRLPKSVISPDAVANGEKVDADVFVPDDVEEIDL